MSYFDLGNNTRLIARQGYGATGGLWDTLKSIGGGAKDLGKGALSLYGEGKTSAGQAQASQAIATAAMQQPQSSTPAWLLPVAAIGGLALVAMLVLKPKRRNPAPRRAKPSKAARAARAASDKAWRRTRIADRDKHFRMIEDTLGIRRGSRQSWDPR